MRNMKTKLILIMVFALFFCGKCDDDDDQSFIIYNNSDKEIIISYGYFTSYNLPSCINYKGEEYDRFIRNNAIKPHSNKNMKNIAKVINPQDTLYIEVFNRIDMDTMSCEEFKDKLPIKKTWLFTKKEAEATNWTVTYP
ncbi:hypothetical protein D0T53_13395 [Dysgonomonas sp. 216]|uniref:hypothetical protein n=1 Tax=Dysgonomonas sp. 216 TaxID=2302934 RepID=UPI0013D5DE9A|nr:hypothetical protein [Dysgonomonas sp. 216]NDW19888.1 hypothetical protein [Dysgonomonas sp. 216]